MKWLTTFGLAIFSLFAVSCQSSSPLFASTPTTSRDQVARAFLDAVLAGQEAEAVKYFEGDANDLMQEDSRSRDFARNELGTWLETTPNYDFTNVRISSSQYATPTPAQEANGFGTVYWYDFEFAYRCKGTTKPYQDGRLRFVPLVPRNGQWRVYIYTGLTQLQVLGCQ